MIARVQQQPATQQRTARAASAAELRATFADPGVSHVILTAHIDLAGLELSLTQPRLVTLESDGPACAALGPAAPAAPSGLCALRAAGLSRHATVRGRGAHLALRGVALVGGRATIGGSVLVSAGAAVSADGTWVANCSANGDGGAFFASGPESALNITASESF